MMMMMLMASSEQDFYHREKVASDFAPRGLGHTGDIPYGLWMQAKETPHLSLVLRPRFSVPHAVGMNRLPSFSHVIWIPHQREECTLGNPSARASRVVLKFDCTPISILFENRLGCHTQFLIPEWAFCDDDSILGRGV